MKQERSFYTRDQAVVSLKFGRELFVQTVDRYAQREELQGGTHKFGPWGVRLLRFCDLPLEFRNLGVRIVQLCLIGAFDLLLDLH